MPQNARSFKCEIQNFLTLHTVLQYGSTSCVARARESCNDEDEEEEEGSDYMDSDDSESESSDDGEGESFSGPFFDRQ